MTVSEGIAYLIFLESFGLLDNNNYIYFSTSEGVSHGLSENISKFKAGREKNKIEIYIIFINHNVFVVSDDGDNSSNLEEFKRCLFNNPIIKVNKSYSIFTKICMGYKYHSIGVKQIGVKFESKDDILVKKIFTYIQDKLMETMQNYYPEEGECDYITLEITEMDNINTKNVFKNKSDIKNIVRPSTYKEINSTFGVIGGFNS